MALHYKEFGLAAEAAKRIAEGVVSQTEEEPEEEGPKKKRAFEKCTSGYEDAK